MEGLKYVIAGTGATGGSIGAYLAGTGRDVTFLARGAALNALRERGIIMKGGVKGDFTVCPVKASLMDDYTDCPDVVFVCVKWYSTDDVKTFLSRVAGEKTVVIPILNIYGTGEDLQQSLQKPVVTDGCIYIAAHISAPGEITQDGEIFRVVYGLRPGQEVSAYTLGVLEQVKADLEDAGITAVYTDKVKRDTFKKFAYTSPMAAAGEYFHVCADAFQKEGEERQTFAAMIGELETLAGAMGIDLDIDIVKTNLDILDNLDQKASTSMQRDIEKGGPSEISGLVYAVEDMAARYGVDMPVYHKIIAGLKSRGLK